MGARKPANRIAALRNSASKAATSDKPETVTLASIVNNPALLTTLTALLGVPAAESDAVDLGSVALSDVKARLAEVGKAATAAARSLSPDDVRVSSKNGTTAYAYTVLKCDSGSVSLGVSVSDAVGKALASHATRR